MAEQHPIVYIYHNLSNRPSVKGHLVCFHVLAVVHSASVNMAEHVSAEQEAQPFHTPMSGVAGSYSMFIFRFFENSLH